MAWSDRAFFGAATLGLAIFLLVMAMLQGGLRPWSDQQIKSEPFQARVVRFGTFGNPKSTYDKLILVARSADGRTGQGVISTARLDELGCKVGDSVSAHMEGPVMIVDTLTCNQIAAHDV